MKELYFYTNDDNKQARGRGPTFPGFLGAGHTLEEEFWFGVMSKKKGWLRSNCEGLGAHARGECEEGLSAEKRTHVVERRERSEKLA